MPEHPDPKQHICETTVVFMPSGLRGHFSKGTTLLAAARSLGVDIDSVCGGRGICGRCQVTVAEGEFAKLGIQSRNEHLAAFADNEIRFNGRKGLLPGGRLSCSARLTGDIVIDVPAESQTYRQIVRKRTNARTVRIDPIIRPLYVDFYENSSDAPVTRLRAALRKQWQIDATVQETVTTQLKGDEKNLTVALREEKHVVAAWSGFRENLAGLSVDIGSTTVAAQLSNLGSGEIMSEAGIMNPQIRYGEDVMSRVSYVMLNPGGQDLLTNAIRTAIQDLATDCAQTARITRQDIVELTIVGNPIMHHLFLGLDVVPLGQAPFPLAEDGPITCLASALNLDLNPGAHVHILPCIAGHVGADTAAVILSEAPQESEDTTLLVDIGTNAEIVLGNRMRLLACSSPTGPAFEGAQISCGQRAAAGAIERVRVDPVTLEPRFKVIGSDLWSDDLEFLSSVGDIGVTGICGSGIIEALAELFLCSAVRSDGLFDPDKAVMNSRLEKDGQTYRYLLHAGPPAIHITQLDIRNIQLAKGAVYAGARLLMDKLAVDHVDRIVLTGAFGSYIDPKFAMVLGLIPDCPLSKVSAAGNAAGTGARIALLDKAARTEIERVVQDVEKIETALDPNFQDQFVGAMAFPHEIHTFPHLSKEVAIPRQETVVSLKRQRRGRRRQR